MNANDKRFIYHEPNFVSWILRQNHASTPEDVRNKHGNPFTRKNMITLYDNPNTPLKCMKNKIDHRGIVRFVIVRHDDTDSPLKEEKLPAFCRNTFLRMNHEVSGAIDNRHSPIPLKFFCSSIWNGSNIIEYVRHNPHLPLDIPKQEILEYAKDPKYWLIESLYSNPNVPRESIKHVLDSKVCGGTRCKSLWNAYFHPSVTWEDISPTIQHIRRCRYDVYTNKLLSLDKIPFSFIKEILDNEDEDPTSDEDISVNPNIPVSILLNGSRDIEPIGRLTNLSQNPNFPLCRIFHLTPRSSSNYEPRASGEISDKRRAEIKFRQNYGNFEKNPMLPFWYLKKMFKLLQETDKCLVNFDLVLGNEFLYNEYTRKKKMKKKIEKRRRITSCSFSNWY